MPVPSASTLAIRAGSSSAGYAPVTVFGKRASTWYGDIRSWCSAADNQRLTWVRTGSKAMATIAVANTDSHRLGAPDCPTSAPPPTTTTDVDHHNETHHRGGGQQPQPAVLPDPVDRHAAERPGLRSRHRNSILQGRQQAMPA